MSIYRFELEAAEGFELGDFRLKNFKGLLIDFRLIGIILRFDLHKMHSVYRKRLTWFVPEEALLSKNDTYKPY